MKGSVKLPVFIDDARKLVNTTQLRSKYLGASYEAEYCQWQTLHGLGSLMKTASLIITPNAYLEGKLLASYPPDPIGDFDVTRATTATRVNSQGLVELVPYNLLTYSEQFDNAAWSKSNVSVTANGATAPNGTLTADKLVENSANSYHLIEQEYISTTPVNYTVSFYVKKAEREFALVGVYTNESKQIRVNLTTGTILSTSGTWVSTSIENIENGWYRVSGVFIGLSNTYIFCGPDLNGSGNPYTGTTGSGIYAWGSQLNEGTLKPYQKTETRLNIPRLDYSNGTCPSILVEPQRTNLVTYSNDFTNAAWIKITTTITPNYAIGPDGNTNASRVQFNAPNSQLYQFVGFQSSSVSSFYVKGTAGETIAIYNSFNGGGLYELRTLTGEWQRIEVVSVGSIVSYSAISNFFGATANDVLVYGAQFELGSYATSYIPTTSASVTRNADVISKTGISSLIGQTEGTIFLDFVLKNPLSATNRIISITETDWASGGSIRLDIDYNKFTADFVNGGSNIGNIGYFTTVQPNTRYKVAIAYKENDCQMYINGVDAGSDTTTAAMPTCSELYLNALGAGFNAPYEASNINSAALWKQRLSNTQLAQLTTL